MTTATTAYGALKALLEGGGLGIPIRWQNEDADSDGNVSLSATPAPFAYCEFLLDPARIASTGGGRFNNIYRNPARLDIYIFVPRGWGLPPALDYAEQAAALFRSFRDSNVSCFDATVYAGGDGVGLTPPGLTSEVGNYFYAVAEVNAWFDQIG